MSNNCNKARNSALCLHDLYVHTLHPNFPELVVILSEDSLAGDAKHRIGETLGLNVESVYLFGLFEQTQWVILRSIFFRLYTSKKLNKMSAFSDSLLIHNWKLT